MSSKLIFPAVFVSLGMCASIAGFVSAQDSSLFGEQSNTSGAVDLKTSSFIFQELPPDAGLRELQLYDIVRILVDYRASDSK